MYINMDEQVNFQALKDVYDKINNFFIAFQPKDIPVDDLVELYSNDDIFLKELKIIEESMNEILGILISTEGLDKEFYNFFSIKFIVNYLADDVKLFLVNISFINNLFNKFFLLIHKKLSEDDDYEDCYSIFLKFLEKQKDYFYTEVYEYDGEYEDLIIETTNILW